MVAPIKFKEGDYVDPQHNLLYIREAGYTSDKSHRRKIGVYDIEYDEYFEAGLNELRRGHTKHSFQTSYMIRSQQSATWNPGETKEICGQRILCLAEIEPHYYITSKNKKHRIRRGRFQNLETLIVFECDFSSARNGSSSGTKKSKGERVIASILTELNIDFETQHVFYDCRSKNNRVLYFDFYLPGYNICIEYDGEQHQKGWKRDLNTLPAIKERDKIKDKYCIQNNIQLIRIPYTELKNINEEYILNILEEAYGSHCTRSNS